MKKSKFPLLMISVMFNLALFNTCSFKDGDDSKVSSEEDSKYSSAYFEECTAEDNSATHYCSNGTLKKYGILKYRGKFYRTIVIASQTWMANNLNSETEGSYCYGEIDSNCDKYGRLYSWNSAMNACPSGWHLPSNADWDKLFRYADGSSGGDSPYRSEIAGKMLKSMTGWKKYGKESGGGTDEFGFSALPGGSYDNLSFSNIGLGSVWWSSSEYSSAYAYYRNVNYVNSKANAYEYDKKNFYSVRCVRD